MKITNVRQTKDNVKTKLAQYWGEPKSKYKTNQGQTWVLFDTNRK